MHKVAACIFAFALAATAMMTTAQAQTTSTSLRGQLIGHWKLISIDVNGQTPYGSDPVGTLFLDAGGHYAIIVVTSGGARSVSYFGGYVADEDHGSVTIHVEGSSDPTAVGSDQTRYVAFEKDEMIVTGRKNNDAPAGLALRFRRDN